MCWNIDFMGMNTLSLSILVGSYFILYIKASKAMPKDHEIIAQKALQKFSKIQRSCENYISHFQQVPIRTKASIHLLKIKGVDLDP